MDKHITSSWEWSSFMAVVASLALHRHCPVSPASSSSSVTRVRTWIPLPNSARRPFWTRTLSESTDTAHSSSSLVCLSSPSSSSSSSSSSPEVTTPPTAESCINLGLSLFSKGRVKDALSQFETALTLDPNPIEAQAAFYNKACCHAYRGEGKKAADCLRTALKEYDLKFGTILNDPDLASFRALPEFKELQEEARLGGEDIGYSFRRDLKLISEVQAPFRGVRRFFYVALTAAAGISMFFTIPRLYRSIKGGDGAPDIWETAGNAAINIGGIIVLVALFLWDNKKEEEQLAQISRDETLSRLPLRLSTNRVVELVQLRDTVRPVILAGNKETVSLALQKAERCRTELLRRGVLLVPVIWGQNSDKPAEKKGFGLSPKAAASLPSLGEDFDKRAQSVVTKSKLKAEIRFKAEPVSPVEWERWIKDQQKSEVVTPGEDVYIILRLDGRVRRSGRGMPDWQQIVKELPEMDALLSKLER
ncbi:protein LOW PSII ACCUMULATION 1, chloroplastic [Coffea eugenioides]|uniref:protein LOW PSII ACCUMULATION 1, chloroplastic n=1 Tax=Coffea eugenioides TaxID=49369 RepID=UPI000F6100FE|nr:protein LOW PSII ACCUMULATION 1, chloroplastic [Coffea eugenioides]